MLKFDPEEEEDEETPASGAASAGAGAAGGAGASAGSSPISISFRKHSPQHDAPKRTYSLRIRRTLHSAPYTFYSTLHM